ncbi:Oidioi.mRNA.OKI2018_I69.chr2.g4392.t1.cds [Oikopleura dioica]|uniref:Oidioi.mRNA.OKI2018_I69.chr2.g4392.t1.cds n=1 Tax=Oikopleura dioica TaxID=34765 RepID=A0ABN7SXL5_OIKDI|nr:Oidioi.mRNA.OKI2018_I69.chr2.g4392.t1.cds [Oikopleura dioica]
MGKADGNECVHALSLIKMAAARPVVSVYSRDGKPTEDTVNLPAVFKAPIRTDIVQFVHTNLSKNARQPYAVSKVAGEQTSAESWGTGRAVARIPRVRGGGTSRSGAAAFGNMCRGGRMFNPTKTWRNWHRRVNITQRRFATVSAIAATVYKNDDGIVRAMRNLPGVTLLPVDQLNLLKLAPGGHVGRFTIYTQAAFEALDRVYSAKNKKGFSMPRSTVSNPDLQRVLQADEVRAALKPRGFASKRTTVKKNPLKNIKAMLKLNPYAAVEKRARWKSAIRNTKEKGKTDEQDKDEDEEMEITILRPNVVENAPSLRNKESEDDEMDDFELKIAQNSEVKSGLREKESSDEDIEEIDIHFTGSTQVKNNRPGNESSDESSSDEDDLPEISIQTNTVVESSMVSDDEIFHDVIVVLDGSDSFNRTFNSEAFDVAQKLVFDDLAPRLAEKFGKNCGMSLVQFSGIKKLTKSYVPGSGGKADSSGVLAHWQIECDHVHPSNAKINPESSSFDGNGQLFLCLQDLSLENFITDLDKMLPISKDRERKQYLLVITDDEWDMNGLRTPEGTEATEEEVTARAKQHYEIFPIIVRDNRASNNNEEFISTHLASRPENVQKVFSNSFEENLTAAFEKIVSSI